MRLSTSQLKLFITGLIVTSLIVLATIFYFKAMKTTNTDININKLVNVDKLYAYRVSSDFYFRVESYDNDGTKIGSFSQIIPTETDIGYDFKNPSSSPELILTSRKREGIINLINKESTNSEHDKIIDILHNFSKEYSKIITLQDQHYFDKVAESTNSILGNLTANKKIVPTLISKYRENEIKTPVSNLVLHPYKLDKTTKNARGLDGLTPCKKSWCANIAKWEFAENDRIYLQYLEQVTTIDLNDYVAGIVKKPSIAKNKKGITVVKTTKIVNSITAKFFFVINNDQSIDSYSMDSNGYIYLLKYRYSNISSLKKYLHDYLKIALGISFIDVRNFTNNFAVEQDKIVASSRSTNETLKNLEDDIGDELLGCFGLNRHKNTTDLLFDEKLNKFIEDKDNLEKEIENKKKLFTAISKGNAYDCEDEQPKEKTKLNAIKGFLGFSDTEIEMEIVIKKCPIKDKCSDMDCVKNQLKLKE